MNSELSIFVHVDKEQLCRISISCSTTCAQLIIHLSQEYNVPSTTYILDQNNYRIDRQDEARTLVTEIMNEQKIVRLIYQKTSFKQKDFPHDTENYNAKRKRDSWARNELLSIFEWLWYISFKPIIIVSIVIIFYYFAYLKIICVQMSFLPIITMYCPATNLDTIVIPAVSELAEKSASLADVLTDTDVSAPMRLIQSKSSLIEIRSRIIYSDIDDSVRLVLGETLGELQKDIQICADHLTDMLASFGGTLDRLQIYTRYLFDDVSKIIREERHTYQGQISNSHENDIQNALSKSCDEYLATVSTQADKILEKAQRAYQGLQTIENKLETLQELSYKGQQISQQKIDKAEHRSFWSRLVDNGQLDIVKNKRNLKILEGFSNYIKKASDGLNDIIIKLQYFRKNAEDLKTTGIMFEQLPHIPIKRHQELLDAAIKRLRDSKQKLSGKMEQQQQIDEDD